MCFWKKVKTVSCFTKTEGDICISHGRTFNTSVNKDIIFQDYGLNFGKIKFYIKKQGYNKKSKSVNKIFSGRYWRIKRY